jgi:hypothetical protein
MMEWFLTYWIEIIATSIIPVLIITFMVLWWWDCHKQKKLEADPHRMDERQYRSFNYKRFEK